MDNNCSSCRFFYVGFGDRMGVCRRFPTFQNRAQTEWCGEFSPKMMELAVIDPPQVDGAIKVELPENNATVELKRRGRPKKEPSDV